jgi:shikimate kinase
MQSGLVVWLNADSETVRARLLEDPNTAAQRPSLTGTDTLSETEKIMAEREPLYRKGAHLHIDSTQPVEIIIATIEKGLEEVKGKGLRGKG